MQAGSPTQDQSSLSDQAHEIMLPTPGSFGNDDGTEITGTLVDLDQALASENLPEHIVDSNHWLSWTWTDLAWHEFESLPSLEIDADPASGIQHSAENRPDQTPSCGDRRDEKRLRIASIVDAKIDPVEQHRQAILAHLSTSPLSTDENVCSRWLSQTGFPRLIKTYFMRHHRHTPIIHLPTFNVAETPTPLIFALALVAASYTPSLDLRAKDIMSLIQFAYRLTLDSDQVNGG
jgi:hypothetical protein